MPFCRIYANEFDKNANFHPHMIRIYSISRCTEFPMKRNAPVRRNVESLQIIVEIALSTVLALSRHIPHNAIFSRSLWVSAALSQIQLWQFMAHRGANGMWFSLVSLIQAINGLPTLSVQKVMVNMLSILLSVVQRRSWSSFVTRITGRHSPSSWSESCWPWQRNSNDTPTNRLILKEME